MKTVNLTAQEIDLIKRLTRGALNHMNKTEGQQYSNSGFSYRDITRYSKAAADNFADRTLIGRLRAKLE